jgi:hypothetical protein
MLLVPADVLKSRRPDEHFAAEASAAAEAGMTVSLVDHDALTTPGGAARGVAKVPADAGAAIYRGWMLRSEQYVSFADELAARGVSLRTSAAHYRQAHELPGWYAALASVTPESVWTVGDTEEGFQRACAELGPGPAVLRDYVKSMKHYWDEAVFIPDAADVAAAWKVARRFRELRDEEFSGGFVLRRFEEFTSAEIRTWWVDGICRLITPHPDTPESLPPGLDLAPFTALIGSMGLPFVSLDLDLRADGVWRVIEMGDGQVSDRPSSTDPAMFVAAILPGI